MLLSSKNDYQSGQTLIEVVVVSFLMMVLLVALVSVTILAVSRNRLAKERAVATRLAQQSIEWLRTERDRLGYDEFASNVPDSTDGTVFCLNTIPTEWLEVHPGTNEECGNSWVDEVSFGRLFHRQLIAKINGTEIEITSLVNWGDNQKVSLRSVINKWQE